MIFLKTISTKIEETIRIIYPDAQSANKGIKQLVNQDLYLLIQKSILSGEYYAKEAEVEISKIDTSLDKLELALTTNVQIIETQQKESSVGIVDETAQRLKSLQLKNEFIRIIKLVKKYKTKYVERFRELVISVKNNLLYFSTGREGVIADTRLLRSYTLKNELAETLESGIPLIDIFNESLFELNILLAYMDEYLECNEEMLSELNSIKIYLKPALRNNLNGEIFDLITYKRAFLEYKILWRNCPRYDSPGISLPDLLPEENVFKYFKDKLLFHYSEIRNSKINELERKVTAFNLGQSAAITLEEFHHLNRGFKKVNKDDDKRFRKTKIKSLLKKLEEISETGTNDLFDQIAYKSIHNLLHNSIMELDLAIEIESKYKTIIKQFQDYILGVSSKPESAFINDQIRKLKEVSDSNFLPDYYCFKIFLAFLTKLIKYLQANPDEIFQIDRNILTDAMIGDTKARAFSLVDYLQNIYVEDIDGIKKNLRKMMTHEVKPAYLTFHECSFKYKWADGMEGKLFLDSSYILPNDFNKIKSEIHQLESLLTAQIISLKSAYEVAVSHIFIEYKKSDFERKVKDNEIKLVQIIAMFVSIATFVLINVKIFDNKTGLESFGIILGLAACFFIFNLFFYFIIMAQLQQGKGAWRKVAKLAWFLLIPVGLCIGSFLVLNKEGGKENGEIKAIKEKMRIDSIESRTIFKMK